MFPTESGKTAVLSIERLSPCIKAFLSAAGDHEPWPHMHCVAYLRVCIIPQSPRHPGLAQGRADDLCSASWAGAPDTPSPHHQHCAAVSCKPTKTMRPILFSHHNYTCNPGAITVTAVHRRPHSPVFRQHMKLDVYLYNQTDDARER